MVRLRIVWVLTLFCAASGMALADPVPIAFQVEPGDATVVDRDSGQVVATSSPGSIGQVSFTADLGPHRYRISRSRFDDVDVTCGPTADGQWQYQSALGQGRLNSQTLFALSRWVTLAVRPEDAQAYVDSEAPNASDTPTESTTEVEVGGLRRRVRPLPRRDGQTRIPNGWSPPLVYLVRPRFETRVLQIPVGALDTSNSTWPPTSIEMHPLYGPFSSVAFDTGLILAVGLALAWFVPRTRHRLQQQARNNALLDDILTSRPHATSTGPRHGLEQRTVSTDSGLRYLLLDKLGQGAMGTVYEGVAVDTEERQHVAVKVLSSAAWSQTEARERFKREVHVCQTLHHPAIVKVLDWGVFEADETEGVAPFMIMELVVGRTLRKVMDSQARMPVPQAVEWLLDCLRGLRAAHQAGIIHRDVKPENLMVTPSNRIKIMDFGIARLQDSNTLTATGGQLGTPAYMSLEHLQAKSVVPSSDLYSLGVVAYEMLVGIRPFNESDVWALVGRLLTEPPPHAMDANPDVPIDLDHVIWTMLATDPSQRYPDCDAVIQALTQPRSEQATIT